MRKILSLFMISLMAVFSLSAKTLYLAPNDDWKSAGARFAVYAFDNGEEWYSMTAVEGETGLYQAAVDDKYPSVIFCRMNGEAAENNWGNKWNQTQDMTIEADKNLCNISGWDNAGAWGVYTPAGGGEDDQYVYVKVTEEPTSWAGEYLIVCDGESVAFNSSLANNTTDYVGIGGKYSRFAVTIHNDTIDYHDTIAAKHFTIAAIEGKTTYSIKSESNLYIGRTSTSNGLDKSSTNVYENAISYNATSECVDIVGSSGAYMRYNKASNEQRFRFFKADTYTAQQPIQLYKKVKLEASEDPGEDPEPPVAEKDSIFFVNASDWIALRVHLWGGSAAGTEWPGVEMTPVAEQINGYEVFKLIVDKGAYANCIFNNNDKGIQTDDLDWNSGKYYYVDAWYAKEAIPAETPVTTFVGFDVQDGTLGTQLAAGLAKNRANVTFVEGEGDNQNKYSVNLVEGGVEGSFTLGGVVFAYKNSAAGATAWKTYLTYIQPNGKDREVRIPLEAGKQAKVVLSEACDGVLVNGESTDLVAGENILTATADGLVLKSGSSAKPKIQAILPVDAPEPPVAEKDSIFFVNVANWGAVRVHLWGGSAAGTDWPGVEMTLEEEQINGHDVYKFIADKGAYANCIFSDNGNNQTGNLDWNSGKYYYVDTWYAKEDIPVPANFYITGSANLVGEEKQWNPAAIAVTENAYTFENLAAGDYKLKLTLEGDWNTAIGFDAMTDTTAGLYTDADANINFTLSAPANITVNFIKGEQGITTFTVTGSYFASPVVKLMGIDADWSTGVLLEDAADHKTASKTLTLAAADQDFKIVVVSDWNGWGYEPLETEGSQYEIKRDHNYIDILVSKDEPNALKLKADVAGEYTFTYNYVTRKLTVDFPAAPVAEKDSIFFVNVANWGAVRVHLWGGSADATDWPGVEMTLEEEQINGHDVYKLIADKGAYANCIFSDNGNNQTGDLDWNSGKYYYVDAWYAKEDIPTVQPEDVVFTVNVPEGTDSVFIAGTFNGWTFDKMNAVEGQENKYTITKTIVDVEGLEYKYTAGRSWDYVEIREGGKNRTWAELDEVTEWLAVPQPAFEHHDFFITGTANLVGSEELAWKPNAIPVDGNSYVLHLGAGTYEMKIVLDSCGASNCQQWFGCERLSDEQVEGVACSKVGNIEFALAGEEDVTVTVDLTDTIITLTGNFYNIQMVDIRLVLSPEWAMDNAQFAAVTWRDGQEMENDGVFTDWFVGTGDTVVGQIPEDATQIAFARFAPEVVEPFMNPDDPYFWNHSDKLIIEPSMIYTITGGDVPGRNFSPGYWGERPEFIADGYFLLGTFNEWTPSAAYEFGLVDEEGQRKVTVALEENDQLKVAEYYRGYRIAWFPDGEDNNYVVDEKHAGSAQDIYFRADYSGDGAWHYGCIYVVDNGATAIDNTAIDAKAEKMLRNGMILIIKGDKTYNVMGQIVK